MSPLDQHDFDEEGEHWPDDCELCIEQDMTVECRCDCGICCQRLLIEASLRDAERESLIAERGKPMYDDCCGTGPRELIGYILNGPEGTRRDTRIKATSERWSDHDPTRRT